MYLTDQQLKNVGFKFFGTNVLISDKVSIYRPENIRIGNNVRIDDFCILSAGDGGIEIGDYIHIACYVSMIGKGKITLKDFSNIAARTTILSSTDDFSGEHPIGPCVPEKYRDVHSEEVVIGKNVIVGAGSIVLPGSIIYDYNGIGAMSLVKKGDITDDGLHYLYAGVPLRKIKKRYVGSIQYMEKELCNNQ